MEKTLVYSTSSIVMTGSEQVLSKPLSDLGFPISLPQPDSSVLYQQANSLHQQGHLDEAESLYREVLEYDPLHHGAMHFLGVIALGQRKYNVAIPCLERALEFCASNAVYHNNYGIAILKFGDFLEARKAFENALILDPFYADAWSNLGAVLMDLNGTPTEIETAFQKSLEINPTHRDALRHLAEFYSALGRKRESANCLIRLSDAVVPSDKPKYLAAAAEHFVQVKNFDAACDLFEEAASLAPNEAAFQERLGRLYGDLGEIPKAKHFFRNASSLSKGKPVWKWKHLGYCPAFFDCSDQINEYWETLHRDLDEAIAEENVFDWRTLSSEGFVPSFHLPHHDRCCRKIKEKFTKLFLPSFPFQRQESDLQAGRTKKVRIGIFITPRNEGGFLRSTFEILRQVDLKRFEIFLFYDETSTNHFHRVPSRDGLHQVTYNGRNFEQSVHKIREYRCDIMYYWKAGADTWSFYFPMTYLAPVQFTSWGTHGTSGMECIDYVLSFRDAEVTSAQEHYTERLYLAEEFPAFLQASPYPADVSRDSLGLPGTGAIYLCPHRLSKYHPDFDLYLKEILENDSNGHVVLVVESSPVTEKFQARLKRNLGDRLMRRMIFRPPQPVKDYERLVAAVTAVLDSPVYSGGITSYDAFSFHVPCVTQTGTLLIQRFPTTSYKLMGIEGLSVTSREEYVRVAVHLGTDRDFRESVAHQIREQSWRIFDRKNVVHEYERFFDHITKTT